MEICAGISRHEYYTRFLAYTPSSPERFANEFLNRNNRISSTKGRTSSVYRSQYRKPREPSVLDYYDRPEQRELSIPKSYKLAKPLKQNWNAKEVLKGGSHNDSYILIPDDESILDGHSGASERSADMAASITLSSSSTLSSADKPLEESYHAMSDTCTTASSIPSIGYEELLEYVNKLEESQTNAIEKLTFDQEGLDLKTVVLQSQNLTEFQSKTDSEEWAACLIRDPRPFPDLHRFGFSLDVLRKVMEIKWKICKMERIEMILMGNVSGAPGLPKEWLDVEGQLLSIFGRFCGDKDGRILDIINRIHTARCLMIIVMMDRENKLVEWLEPLEEVPVPILLRAIAHKVDIARKELIDSLEKFFETGRFPDGTDAALNFKLSKASFVLAAKHDVLIYDEDNIEVIRIVEGHDLLDGIHLVNKILDKETDDEAIAVWHGVNYADATFDELDLAGIKRLCLDLYAMKGDLSAKEFLSFVRKKYNKLVQYQKVLDYVDSIKVLRLPEIFELPDVEEGALKLLTVTWDAFLKGMMAK